MLLSHTLKYLPAQLLSPLAQLASMVLWTHWLAPAEMGAFTLVTVTQELAYLVCLGWFAVYLLRYWPKPEQLQERQRLLASENTVVLGSLLGSLLVAGLTASWLGPTHGWWASAAAVGAFFASKAVSTHYAERARAQAAFVPYTLLQVTGPVGGLLLGWLALSWVESNVIVLLLAYALAQGLGVLLALPLLGVAWVRPRWDAPLLRAAMGFGGPVLLLSALGWVAENYIRYLVQWHSGAAALGLMIVGWALGRRAAAVAATLVTTASFPLAARLLNDQRREEALGHLALNAALMVGVLLPVTLGVEVLGPTLVELFVASEYQAITAELLALSVVAGALRNLHMHTTDQLMVLERKVGMLAKLDVFEIVLCCALSLAGLMLEGLRGAVIGQALGSLVTLVLSAWLAQRHLGFAWPWRDTGRIAVAAMVMLAALLGLQASHDLQGLVMATALGTLSYGATLALLYRQPIRRLLAARKQGTT